MSKDEITLKEYVENYMNRMEKSVLELHSKLDDVKIITDSTQHTVSVLESTIKELAPLVKAHDLDIRKNTITAEVTEKRSKMIWNILKWWAIPFFTFIGWVGYLYLEHIQRQLVEQSVALTSEQVETKVEQLLQEYKAQINIQ